MGLEERREPWGDGVRSGYGGLKDPTSRGLIARKEDVPQHLYSEGVFSGDLVGSNPIDTTGERGKGKDPSVSNSVNSNFTVAHCHLQVHTEEMDLDEESPSLVQPTYLFLELTYRLLRMSDWTLRTEVSCPGSTTSGHGSGRVSETPSRVSTPGTCTLPLGLGPR